MANSCLKLSNLNKCVCYPESKVPKALAPDLHGGFIAIRFGLCKVRSDFAGECIE